MNQITKGEGTFGKVTASIANITSPYIGGTAVNAGATEINNQCDLSAAGALRKFKTISLSSTVGSSAIDTGWALPSKGAVYNVFLKIDTATTATGTISVGLLATTSGDADGFLAAVPSSSGPGTIRNGTITCTSSGFTVGYYGVLLTGGTTPVVNTTANIQVSGIIPYVWNELTSSRNISYTCSTTANGSLAGQILIDYIEFA